MRLNKTVLSLACVACVLGATADSKKGAHTEFITISYQKMLPAERDMYAGMLKQAREYKSQANTLRQQASAIRESEGAKAGVAAIGDGISTMSVLSKGGTEFNPIHPTTPWGIVGFTGLKYWLSTSYIKSRPLEEQDRARRVASAGWGGAALGNFAALAGAAPQVSIPIALASMFGLYQHSSAKIEEIDALSVQAKALEDRSVSVMYAANNFKNQALARAKVREDIMLAENQRLQQIQDRIQAALTEPSSMGESLANAPKDTTLMGTLQSISVAVATPVAPRPVFNTSLEIGKRPIMGRSIEVFDETAEVVALDMPPRNKKAETFRTQPSVRFIPVEANANESGAATLPAPNLRNQDVYQRALELQRNGPSSIKDDAAPSGLQPLKPLESFIFSS